MKRIKKLIRWLLLLLKKLICKLLFLLSVYIFGGVLLGGIVFLLKVVGLIKIKHNISPEVFENGLIVVSNHPSLIDPLLISSLFCGQYMRHPFKSSPWNIAEAKNYNKWYWRWAGARIIWVDRDNPQEARGTFQKARKVLNSKGILVILPEGGRTSSNSADDLFSSPEKGKKLRPLKRGVGVLIRGSNVPVYCAWIDGSDKVMRNLPGRFYTFPRFWKKITITIGEPLRFDRKEASEVISQKLVTTLLKLADEE